MFGYQMMAGRLAQLCAFLMDDMPAGELSIVPEARLEGMEFRFTYQLPLKG